MKKTIIFAVILSTLSCCWADSLWREKLTASDAGRSDRFGMSISTKGDFCIVGAEGDDDLGDGSGSAYIYKFDGVNWTEHQKLLAFDGGDNAYFGKSVSISSDICAVGANGDNENGSRSGAAYIYRYISPNWVYEAKLTASDGKENDEFGRSISVSGNVCVVGVPWEGVAYIYRFNGTDWVEEQKIVHPGLGSGFFGQSVSVDGDFCVIGASQYNNGEGTAYFFQYQAPNWIQMGGPVISNDPSEAEFGHSASIDGDRCIIGAWQDWVIPGDAMTWQAGSAYIFKYEDPNWVEEQKISASDIDDRDYFGTSVSIDNDTCVVGAHANDDMGGGSGSAYIFRFNGAYWYEDAKLLAYDGLDGDDFGYSVSIDDDNIVIGAFDKEKSGNRVGAAYTFRPCPAADANGDCFVSFADLAVMAEQWLIGETLP